MKTNLCILFFILNGFFAVSQTELPENEVKTFKQKVMKAAQSTNSIESDFLQTKHLSVLQNELISEGKLYFKSPNQVKWEYTKPYKNIAVFKDDKLLTNNDGKKSQMNLNDNRLFKSLNSLIVNSIKGDMFDETQFDISYFGVSSGYLVKFIPKDKRLKKFLNAFELKFDKTNAEVNEIKLIEPNDDFTTIVFKNKRLNGQISDALFTN